MASRVVGWLFVLLVPGVVLSTYLYVSRTIRVFSATSDYAALGVSVAVGLVGVFLLVRPPRSRLAPAALYLFLAGAGMYWSMFRVVCVVFGDCYS